MQPVVPYELNSPQMTQKLLIATQGSAFKDSVTTMIVNQVKHDSLYIKVTDVDSLIYVDPAKYHALVLIHTWENWKPPQAVKDFINRTIGYRGKIVVLTTSGSGDYKMENVDALTGESIIDDAPFYSEEIVQKIKKLLVTEL